MSFDIYFSQTTIKGNEISSLCRIKFIFSKVHGGKCNIYYYSIKCMICFFFLSLSLQVAKKKAEVHDKLVLDITRQGGLPTVLSLVSSGIKRVSSSPPKEGGMSFFKASSPPKESVGFAGRGLVSERRLLPTFLSSERSESVIVDMTVL